uniref:EGF-like domain-containing protein n=1 Tax=Setaria digitata TaxID=48799 RepID=A0A915PL06_9BILA
MVQLLLLPLFLLLPYDTVGHVALTFPSARFPPLDFLDTARTVSPCGTPRPENPHYIQLYTGESYNFTWRLQYPHQGGYRLSVLNESGDIVEQLAPLNDNEYAGTEDQTLQYATVRPKYPCNHCIILLERQALEWGSSYQFRSCADVNIIQEIPNDEERCSKHGDYENGKCKCRHLYSGDLCQYKDHCSTDQDCLNDGKCVKESNAIIRRTCYCSFGYFGQNCDRTFDGKPENDECFNYNYPRDKNKYGKYGLFKQDCFKKTKLNKDDFIYSRVVQDELEVILDFKSMSWISIGWRPMELDRSCRLFPDLENTRYKRSATRTNPITHMNGSHHPDTFGNAPEIVSNRVPIPMPKLPENNGLLRTALEAPLHPMDCTDIVIGSVRDGRSRINDMYTRDRSTPLHDTWIDGEESFSAAYGIERDGRTIIMFRRRIAEIEPSDHPLGPGEIFVIYAKGQSSARTAKSTSDKNFINNNNFYKYDEVKYHGNTNRGIHPIEFVSFNERPPSIRPAPPRFQHRNQSPPLSSPSLSPSSVPASVSSSLQHQSTEMRDSSVYRVEIPKLSQSISPSIAATTARDATSLSSLSLPSSSLSSSSSSSLSLSSSPSSSISLSSSSSHATIAVRKSSITKSNFKTKLESTGRNKLPQSTPEFELESNSQEIDYLYFDNGSLPLMSYHTRLFYFFMFSLFTYYLLLFENDN